MPSSVAGTSVTWAKPDATAPLRMAGLPGQLTISGTRSPPSLAVNLYPRNGAETALAKLVPIAVRLPGRPC